MKRPRKNGWYRWVPTDDDGPYPVGDAGTQCTIVGYAFKGDDSRWGFYGTHVVLTNALALGADGFAMYLSSFVGHGDFAPTVFDDPR